MKCARDLMTPDPKRLQSGMEIREAVGFFLEHEIHSAPVVNPLGETLGMLTDLGLIKSYLRHYLDTDKHEKIAHHQDILEKPGVVQEDASLGEVIKTLLKSPSHRILVNNRAGALTGIISPGDILRFLTGELKQNVNIREELHASKQKIEALATEVDNLHAMLTRYKSLFLDTPYMMHSADANGVIMMANKKLHEILGYEPNELIGRTIFEIYPKNVHLEAKKGLEKIQRDGFHHMTYTSMVKKNGDRIRVDLASSALKGPTGNFVGTITISRTVDSDSLVQALHGLVDKDQAHKLFNSQD